ncbi:MAG: hypothetical protein RLO81_02655, partial [Fulvivirga sp.]|uniref:hypothetical protein n=1 Tax=Fulvivirga sp. TaxID=1931237 RepID=UPI0032EAD1C1
YDHLYTIDNVDDSGILTMQDSAGFARVLFDFDKYGNEQGWSFYDTNGDAAERKPYKDMGYGYSIWMYEMDWLDREKGLSKGFQKILLDIDSLPTTDNSGIHITKYEFADFDQLKSMEYMDTSKALVVNMATGYAKLVVEYDESGNRAAVNRYDNEGNLIE